MAKKNILLWCFRPDQCSDHFICCDTLWNVKINCLVIKYFCCYILPIVSVYLLVHITVNYYKLKLAFWQILASQMTHFLKYELFIYNFLFKPFKKYINLTGTWTVFFLCFRFWTFYLLFPSKEYEKALKYIRTLLKNEPGNKQALELEKLIDKALKKGKSPIG